MAVCNIIRNVNRTNSGYVTGTGNQLTNDGVYTYTYDAEGNLTKKSKGPSLETWKFTYDNRNHMTVAEKWSADTGGTLQMRATYTYDVFGNRDKTEVDPDGAGATGVTTTKFVLDGWKTHQDVFGQPAQFVGNENWDEIADLDGSNSLVTRRLSLNTVDSVFAKIASDGTANWFLGDHLGSIKDITSLTMAVVDHRDWDAFGNLVTETSSANGDRYGWTSREVDGETGLQYNRLGYLSSALGRFTAPSLGAGSTNFYSYFTESPTVDDDQTKKGNLTIDKPGTFVKPSVIDSSGNNGALAVEGKPGHIQAMTGVDYTVINLQNKPVPRKNGVIIGYWGKNCGRVRIIQFGWKEATVWRGDKQDKVSGTVDSTSGTVTLTTDSSDIHYLVDGSMNSPYYLVLGAGTHKPDQYMYIADKPGQFAEQIYNKMFKGDTTVTKVVCVSHYDVFFAVAGKWVYKVSWTSTSTWEKGKGSDDPVINVSGGGPSDGPNKAQLDQLKAQYPNFKPDE
jgi:RHS repeat-associated protein